MKAQRQYLVFHIFKFKGYRKNEDKSTMVFCIKTWDGLIETACVPAVFPFGVPLLLGGWGTEGRVDDT